MATRKEILDVGVSVVLLPITALALGFAFYLTTVNIWLLPSVPLAATLFGLSCMGPKRIVEHDKLVKGVGDE